MSPHSQTSWETTHQFIIANRIGSIIINITIIINPIIIRLLINVMIKLFVLVSGLVAILKVSPPNVRPALKKCYSTNTAKRMVKIMCYSSIPMCKDSKTSCTCSDQPARTPGAMPALEQETRNTVAVHKCSNE